MPHVFISYSKHDRTIATSLKTELEKYGADIFIDYARIKAGEDFPDRLRLEIDKSDYFLYLVSNHSIESRWVQAEVEYAYNSDKYIIPIMLEVIDVGKIWFLNRFDRIDYTQPQNFDHVIKRLVTALNLSLAEEVEIPGEPSELTLVSPEEWLQEFPVLAHFPKVKSINRTRHVTEGNSGSKVFVVKATLREGNQKPQGCFLKIHHAQGNTPLMRHEAAYETLKKYMPEILDSTTWDETALEIALLYKVNNTDGFVSLDRLLQHQCATAQKLIETACNALEEWNGPIKPEKYDYSPPHRLLQLAMSHSEDAIIRERRLYDPDVSIYARLAKEFELTPEATHIRFEGPGFHERSIWRNPLAYLAYEQKWQSKKEEDIAWLWGHTHGDLNVRNVLSLDGSGEALSLIDFDTYDRRNLIFIDYFQLELGVILNLCPPSTPDNQAELVTLSEYLARSIELEKIPDLGVRAVGINEILRPIRTKLASFAAEDRDLVAAIWLARVAVGLELARKKKTRPGERVFALLFAADSLDKLLKYFHIDTSKEEQHFGVVRWPTQGPTQESQPSPQS